MCCVNVLTKFFFKANDRKKNATHINVTIHQESKRLLMKVENVMRIVDFIALVPFKHVDSVIVRLDGFGNSLCANFTHETAYTGFFEFWQLRTTGLVRLCAKYYEKYSKHGWELTDKMEEEFHFIDLAVIEAQKLFPEAKRFYLSGLSMGGMVVEGYLCKHYTSPNSPKSVRFDSIIATSSAITRAILPEKSDLIKQCSINTDRKPKLLFYVVHYHGDTLLPMEWSFAGPLYGLFEKKFPVRITQRSKSVARWLQLFHKNNAVQLKTNLSYPLESKIYRHTYRISESFPTNYENYGPFNFKYNQQKNTNKWFISLIDITDSDEHRKCVWGRVELAAQICQHSVGKLDRYLASSFNVCSKIFLFCF